MNLLNVVSFQNGLVLYLRIYLPAPPLISIYQLHHCTTLIQCIIYFEKCAWEGRIHILSLSVSVPVIELVDKCTGFCLILANRSLSRKYCLWLLRIRHTRVSALSKQSKIEIWSLPEFDVIWFHLLIMTDACHRRSIPKKFAPLRVIRDVCLTYRFRVLNVRLCTIVLAEDPRQVIGCHMSQVDKPQLEQL